MTHSFLESIVEAVAPAVHTFIKKRNKRQQEHQARVERVQTLLAEHGYRSHERTWCEEDWQGRQISYPVTYTYHYNDMIHSYGLVALPVSCKDKGRGAKSSALLLVDLSRNKVHTLFHSTTFEGSKPSIKPLSIHENAERTQALVPYLVKGSLDQSVASLERIAHFFTTGTTQKTKVYVAAVALTGEGVHQGVFQ
jgi:hypothetical protein